MNPFAFFETVVAFRFMREGLTQTLLIVFGVALGAGVIIFMSALLAGLQTNIIRRTLNFQAPIQILAPDQVARSLRADDTAAVASRVQPRSQQLRSLDQWQKVRAGIERMPEVVGVTPVVTGPGSRGAAKPPRPSRSSASIPIPTSTSSRCRRRSSPAATTSGPTDIVIGTELAKDLGTERGRQALARHGERLASTLIVVGIFDFGNKGVNERNVYVALRTAQNLLDLAGGAPASTSRCATRSLRRRSRRTSVTAATCSVDSWISTNAQFFSAMSAQILANTLIRIFVGITVALGIASVLVVSVVQKSKEIGILRAMGTARAQMLRVFLIQGGFMGLTGRASRLASRAGASSCCGAASRAIPTDRRCSSS